MTSPTSPVRSAADQVRAAIAASPDGAIPFEQYMEIALYGEHGFYTRPELHGAGRRRDFITSPEVGPLFGAVISRMLDAEWERLGQPDPFHVVDLGAGPGTLARSVLAAEPACIDALHYVAVERSGAQRARHPEGVESVAAVDEAVPGAVDGVVIANEVLDNVPFALAVFDGNWREAYVIDGGEGEFVEVLSAPFDPVPAVLPASARHGARAPLQHPAARVVTDVLGRLRSGSCHVFDYARPTTAAVCDLDWRGWLRTYRGHERAGHYLQTPGSMDITADVMADQLSVPDAVCTQAEFLSRWGIDELVEEGRRRWEAAASSPTLEAMRMRSRIRESEALLDPAGLGGFTVLEWRR